MVIGTRPEAVKMAPVVHALRAAPWAECRVLATAQHRQMLDQILGFFGITPDRDLDLMRPDQSLADLTARMITAMDPVLAEERPDVVLAQGDTTTVMVAALCSFYRRIRFGHVDSRSEFLFEFPRDGIDDDLFQPRGVRTGNVIVDHCSATFVATFSQNSF